MTVDLNKFKAFNKSYSRTYILCWTTDNSVEITLSIEVTVQALPPKNIRDVLLLIIS
jgi:hypothetical protein